MLFLDAYLTWHLPPLFPLLPLPPLEVSQTLVGRDKMELYVFDVQKESISVHQPLPRVLAGEYICII